MGYYCTVPQCTSLAGKTKNVKFHRFPRDVTMADKWNVVLKRGKPYTKYSKVCSLHFTQGDYNVTTMGQWKTLSKDAVPTQNLPKLNPDGSVMVIRKSRTIKCKKEDSDKADKSWQSMAGHSALPLMSNAQDAAMGQEGHDNSLSYRLQNLGSAVAMSSQVPQHLKPKKQDAIMQTDPVQNEDDDTQPNNSYSEVSEKSYSSEMEQYNQNYPKTASPYPKDVSPYTNTFSREPTPYAKEAFPRESTPFKDPYSKDVVSPKDSYPKESFHKNCYQKESFPKESFQKESYPKESYQKESYPKESFQKDDVYDSKSYEPKDYTKSSDYIPQTNEEYNKAAEQYALERKSHNEYGKEYRHKHLENGFHKLNDLYGGFDKYRSNYFHQNGYPDSVDVLRNQQHNLQILQEQHRVNENQNFFTENAIKQEIDINVDDDKFMYERSKEHIESSSLYVDRLGHNSRYTEQMQPVKEEPDTSNGCEPTTLAPSSPYYNVTQYYEPRPGAELLIAKQNKLAAQAQLWPNPMKRPFYYSEAHYPASPMLHRYEDIPRILQ